MLFLLPARNERMPRSGVDAWCQRPLVSFAPHSSDGSFFCRWFIRFQQCEQALRAHSPARMQSLKHSSARLWSRCWKMLWEVGTVICVSRPLTSPSERFSGHSLLLNIKRKVLLLVPRYPTATLSTSVRNDPSFTTHDLLRLLCQSSPYTDILTEFTYSSTRATYKWVSV
jgi:hypothetical protein